MIVTVVLGLVVSQSMSAQQVRQVQARSVASQPGIPENVKASLASPPEALKESALRDLDKGEQERLDKVIRQLRAGDQAGAEREWRSLIEQAHEGRSETAPDTDAMIQYVLHESYVRHNKDLQYHAEKVRSPAANEGAGGDARLANLDLQDQLQKQQQTMQTMSNVSKMLHDTAMAVIRKIG